MTIYFLFFHINFCFCCFRCWLCIWLVCFIPFCCMSSSCPPPMGLRLTHLIHSLALLKPFILHVYEDVLNVLHFSVDIHIFISLFESRCVYGIIFYRRIPAGFRSCAIHRAFRCIWEPAPCWLWCATLFDMFIIFICYCYIFFFLWHQSTSPPSLLPRPLAHSPLHFDDLFCFEGFWCVLFCVPSHLYKFHARQPAR